jgi:hypothetical protein
VRATNGRCLQERPIGEAEVVPDERTGAHAAERPRSTGWRAAAAGIGAVAIAAFVAKSFGSTRLDPISSPVVVAAFLAAGFVIVTVSGRRERRFDLVGIFATGVALRAVGMLARLEGAVDGVAYHTAGLVLAEQYRQLDFDVTVGRPIPGTGTIRVAAGLIDAVTGNLIVVPFALFTVASVVGMVLVYQAFVEGIPDGDHRRYAILLAIWPTMWFWPSSLGKEAWMLAGIGLCALGAVRLLNARWVSGITMLAAGLTLTGFVRPHVGLIIAAALGAALLGRSGGQTRGRLLGRIVAVIAIVIGGALLAEATADRFDVDSLGTEQVSETLTYTTEQTTQGGSGFNPAVVNTPLDLPWGAVTVLLRPLPGEVGDPAGLAASLETLVLLGLLFRWRRSAWALIRSARARPYVIFSLAFIALFVWAFSNIGNFGILVRQRSQVLPFVLLFLAGPAAATTRSVVRQVVDRPSLRRVKA